ncbi:MAG: urease accessory protein UreD, partial [Pseudomonadota bacterium]
LRVDAGARAVWLPQELILFDGARLRRRAEAQLDANASLFLAETWTLGRAAMGEVVRSGALFDRWRIYRGDALVWADGFALDSDDVGDLQAHIEQAAVLNANRALMSAVLVCDDPQRFVEAIRNALRAPSSHRFEAAVTHVGAALVVRAVSDNARWLRAALHRVVDALGSDAQDGNPLSGCRLPTVFHY